jgi:glycosyltransferase involved in cell wall biosynthesis
MHILVISNLYPPDILGGYEISCSQIVDGLRRRGHRVTVLTTGIPFASREERFDVRRTLYLSDLYRQVGGNPAHHRVVAHVARVSCYFNIYQVLNALDELRPEIVYAFNLLGLGVMGLVDTFNQVGVPWVWHLGDAGPKDACQDVSAAVRSNFRSGDGDFSGGGIVVVSKRVYGEIVEAGVKLGQDINYIQNWGIVGPRPPTECRRGDGTIRFVNAGAMGTHKGTDLIVEAAGHLVKRGRTAFSVDLIGPGDTAAFDARARALGVDRHLHFLGPKPQPELYALYPGYDGFLFPTWYREPFGMAPVEAASVGCPPIMTFGCGVAEWFTHNVHCLKIVRDAAALADAMERLIADPDLRAALSRRAQHLATTSLDFEHALTRIERVLDRRRGPTGWDKIDWPNLYREAYAKDRRALSQSVDGI